MGKYEEGGVFFFQTYARGRILITSPHIFYFFLFYFFSKSQIYSYSKCLFLQVCPISQIGVVSKVPRNEYHTI